MADDWIIPDATATATGPADDWILPDVGYDTAVGRGFTRGASFGLRDEGSGLIAAGGGDPNDPNVGKALLSLGRGVYRKLIAGDPEAQRLYEAEVARQRAQTKQIEQQYPGTSLAGEVAGAVAVPIGGALRAPTLAGRIGRGAALGAGTGALTGFGEGEGTAGSLAGAAIGAPLGAAVGGAAVPLVEGAVRGAGALISKPASIIAGNLNPERAAQRAIGRAAMEAEQSDPAGLQRFTPGQLPGQPEGVVADVLGEPGRRLARSAGNISGEAAETLNQTINPRLEGQAGRITRWIDDTLAFPNAHAQQQALEATQRTANSAAYRRAYEQGANGIWTPELERLASSGAVADAMRTAVKTAGDEAVVGGRGGFNPRISFTPDGRIQFGRGPTGVPTYPDLQYWDQVRRELSDAAIRAGRGTEEARRLTRFATALNTELDRAVPTYQVARRTAAGFFGAENALEAGQAFATQKFGTQEARQAVARMSDTERALFRDGYASRLKEIIAAQGDRRDLVKKIAATPAEREKMEIALGRQRANQLIAMMHAESIMQKLIPAVQGNSSTVMQLLGAGGAGAGAGGYLGYDPTTSGITTALMAGLKGRGDRAVAQHVARLLTSRDPQVLQRGIAVLARNNRNMALLAKIDEAVTRIGAQQAVQNIPGRQHGGPVEEDRPYLVGEAGPETFVPDDPWARAAARTGRRGRAEGAGTRFVEGGYGIPSAYRSLDEGARRAFEEGGKLQHYGNEYYDAGPVTQQAIGATAAPLVGPAQAGAVLGAGAIRRPELWHGISKVKLPRPVAEMAATHTPTAQLAEQVISPESLQGGMLLPAWGDRSRAGSLLTAVGERNLRNPVEMQGGHGFMSANADTGAAWASGKPVVGRLANQTRQLAESGKPVYFPYTAMGERSVDFSHHVSDTLAEMVKAKPLPREAATKFDEMMRTKDANFPELPGWPGLRSPNLGKWLAKASGDARNKFAKKMDTAEAQALGLPSVAEARAAVTDPRLLDVPTGAAGQSIARLDPEGRVITDPARAHRTYDTQLGGQYVGGLGQSVPKEIMYPDMLAAYQKMGYDPFRYDYLMQRGVRGAPIAQRADQQWVDSISQYLEQARRQGQ